MKPCAFTTYKHGTCKLLTSCRTIYDLGSQKTRNYRESEIIYIDNLVPKILRLFHFLPSFSFATSETVLSYYL